MPTLTVDKTASKWFIGLFFFVMRTIEIPVVYMLVDAVSSICSLVDIDVALHFLDWRLQEKRHYKVREGLSFEVNFGFSAD